MNIKIVVSVIQYYQLLSYQIVRPIAFLICYFFRNDEDSKKNGLCDIAWQHFTKVNLDNRKHCSAIITASYFVRHNPNEESFHPFRCCSMQSGLGGKFFFEMLQKKILDISLCQMVDVTSLSKSLNIKEFLDSFFRRSPTLVETKKIQQKNINVATKDIVNKENCRLIYEKSALTQATRSLLPAYNLEYGGNELKRGKASENLSLTGVVISCGGDDLILLPKS